MWLKIFGAGPLIVRRQRLFPLLQTSVGLSTEPDLHQNESLVVVHRIAVRWVEQPFRWRNEVWKMGLAPVLRYFCLVSRFQILLKCLICIDKVLLSPGKHNSLEYVAAWKRGTLTASVDSPQNHHWSEILCCWGAWRFCGPFVLVVNSIATLELAASLQLYAFVWGAELLGEVLRSSFIWYLVGSVPVPNPNLFQIPIPIPTFLTMQHLDHDRRFTERI